MLSRLSSPFNHPERLDFDTVRSPPSIIAPHSSPHTGSCPAPPLFCRRSAAVSALDTLSLELTATFFAPQCTLLSGCAHLGRGRTASTPSFPTSPLVFAPRQWPSCVDTPLAMSPLTGSGFGQVSPGAASLPVFVRLRSLLTPPPFVPRHDSGRREASVSAEGIPRLGCSEPAAPRSTSLVLRDMTSPRRPHTPLLACEDSLASASCIPRLSPRLVPSRSLSRSASSRPPHHDIRPRFLLRPVYGTSSMHYDVATLLAYTYFVIIFDYLSLPT
ncbi:hypothetical protein VTO73DRAFT_7 [Trametes versicolor]